MEFETILYAVDGPVATITMNRPDAANAQNSKMLYEIDAALDAADANDDVRVVVLAGAGKHFSAGHDLKEILSGADEWARLRDTPEGKLRHEQVMYWDKCLRLRDFRKPTIAAVHGAVAAAGMMLACMCDLIVAADDTKFSNPVARMTGVGVEILVEPWELGPRKAKEFLWCAQKLDAETASRRPIGTAHTIWEIVRHIETWDRVVLRRLQGGWFEPTEAEDWPPVEDRDEPSWRRDVASMIAAHEELNGALRTLPPEALETPTAPGKRALFHMVYGAIEHELYHAGQIAILRKG